MDKNGEIMLTAEDGSEEAFFVVEKAEIAGREYLLVTSQEQGGDDTEDVETALILRVNEQNAEKDMLVYDVVDDEKELLILSKYFEELVDDLDLSMLENGA